MMDPLKIGQNKLLVVEGQDAYRFFIKFLHHLKIFDVQVINFGGNDDLRKQLIALPKIPGFHSVKTLAVIRDAEMGHPNDALNSISNALKINEITCPKELNTFEKDNDRDVGVFILPDNQNEGMLEDLCINSIQDENECINKFLNCAKLSHDKISKAKMLCYFAIKDPKVNSISIASQKNMFDFEHDCFNNIKDFLNLLA
ncbi:MAG: DUF3226 domain-containing protein [Bacteroidota bacterium]